MVQTLQFTATILAALLSFQAVASPVAAPESPAAGALEERCVGYWGYATFYDDHGCTQNAGQAVDMGNSGCLANEFGRNSVYIQAGCGGNAHMVWSPGNTCNCQDDCAEVPEFDGNSNGCWDLGGHAGASSFRFITEGCGGNNC